MYEIASRKGLNIDITHRCPLECQRCQRFMSFTSKGLKVTGADMLVEDFQKVINHFRHINFCGQVSDPVHHPKFVEFLQMTSEAKTSVSVHHASAGKPMNWYPKAWKANNKARWWFGIDGLPHESHIYRKNQDGEKLYKIMCNAVKYLVQKPVWQYIVFKYNEDHIEEAYDMAEKAGVEFMLVHSSRWLGDDDPFRPTKPEYSLDLRKT